MIKDGEWGGVARYVVDLSEALSEHGHDVVILSGAAAEVDRRFSALGLRIVKAPLKKFGDMRSFKALWQLLKGNEPVVVHAHTFLAALPAIVARRLAGARQAAVVVTRHIVKRGKDSRFNRWLYRNVDGVAFVSRVAMDAFLSASPTIGRHKLTVIHNSLKHAAVAKASPRVCNKPLRLVFVGRLCPDKGIETLLEAMALVGDVDLALDVVGSGDGLYLERLKEKAHELGIAQRVAWHGFHSDVAPFIEGADVGVAPSLCRESFCFAALEYMSHGRPVITTDNGGQVEFVADDGDGLLVPAGDAHALAKAIRRLACSEELRSRLGDNALAHYREHLAYPVFVNKMEQFYAAAIASRRAR